MDILNELFDLQAIRKRTMRQNLSQFVLASYSIIGSYMVWKLLCVLLNNDSPVVSVLSESMEPGFKRGDILFLKPQTYKTGDILVYQVRKNDIPIVHRVIRINNKVEMLTKGDNNRLDDVGLYLKGRTFLTPAETRSGVFGYIPFFGMITIWISSIPGLKFAVMAISAWLVFANREDERGGSFI